MYWSSSEEVSIIYERVNRKSCRQEAVQKTHSDTLSHRTLWFSVNWLTVEREKVLRQQQ